MPDKAFRDHLRRKIDLPFPPKRIVSLCPSITETLFDLGLEDRIVGRTRYCIHPEDLVKNVKTVGGTKKIKQDVIDELNPDLIVAEKEENPKEAIEALETHYPVFVTDVETYDDGLRMILDLGTLTDREEKAAEMVSAIKKKFQNLLRTKKQTVAYVIWKNPYMVAGSQTYIDSLLEKAGFTNVFGNLSERYPTVSIEDFREASPDTIFLASEPFPFQESHRKEFEQQVPKSQITRIDGEICWYGSRMLKAADKLNRLTMTV
ncbi:MAG TPA: helical backbone metal receptor [Bacillales bacterium]|nr:helical backbone metal receptor [Bacillales bacterium]